MTQLFESNTFVKSIVDEILQMYSRVLSSKVDYKIHL